MGVQSCKDYGEMTQNDTLTAKQRNAIDCLIRNRTVDDAAKCAGVGRKTLYRWLDSEQFSTALTEERNQIAQRARNDLATMISDATTALHDALTDELTHPARVGVRVRAAVAILETALKIEEMVNFDERLRKLEALMDAKQ